MSWLGDSFSSFTGQLTNFTKEVLSEGREEISDHAAEIRVLQQRVRELEAHIHSDQKEIERLHCINGELDARAESSELQLKSLGRDHRLLLQEKENEINILQQKNQELQDLQEKIIASAGNLPSPSYHGSSTSFPTGDEMDFNDVISSQHEINRLYDTVRRLQVERDRWKHLASHVEPSAEPTNQIEQDDSNQTYLYETNKQLESRLKDLEFQLHTLVDDHHRELSALHDIYSGKLNLAKQSQQIYVSELENKVKELESRAGQQDNIEGNFSNSSEKNFVPFPISDSHHNKEHDILKEIIQEKEQILQNVETKLQEVQTDKMKLEKSFNEVKTENENIKKTIAALHMSEKELQTQLLTAKQVLQSETDSAILLSSNKDHLSILKNKLAAAETKIGELLNEREQICCDLYATKHKLLAQLHSSHASNAEMLLEVQLARQKFSTEIENAQMKLEQEKEDLGIMLADMNEQDINVKKTMEAVEANCKEISHEQGAIIEYLGDPEHQELVAGAIHALELENKVLKQNYERLQKQLEFIQQDSDLSKLLKDKTNESSLHRTDSDKTLENSVKRSDFESEETGSKFSLRKARSGSNISDKSETLNLQTPPELEEFETSSYTSSFSELSLRNKELDDQVRLLQSQIELHERDIEHFEMVKADWQMEKNALEEVLTRLRTQLRVKEMSLSLLTAQRGLLEVRKLNPNILKGKYEEPLLGEGNIEVELNHLFEQVERTSLDSHLENERDILKLEKEKLLEELHKVNKENKELAKKLQQIESSDVTTNKTDDIKEQVGLKLRIKELEESVSYITTERDALALGLEDLNKNHQAVIGNIVDSQTEYKELFEKASAEHENLKIELESKVEENAALIEQLKSLKLSSNFQHSMCDYEELQEKDKLLAELNLLLHKASLVEPVEGLRAQEEYHNILQLLKGLISSKENLEIALQKQDSDIKNYQVISNNTSDIVKELEIANQTIENLQRELSQLREDKAHSLWEVESWVDISEGNDKNDKENNMNTKLQDLELESTSSKQSKESSEDSQEKYGELVHRKDELEVQIKELEKKLGNLQNQFKEFEKKTELVEENAEKTNIASLKKDNSKTTTHFSHIEAVQEKLPSVEDNLIANVDMTKLKRFISFILQNKKYILDNLESYIDGLNMLTDGMSNQLDDINHWKIEYKKSVDFKETVLVSSGINIDFKNDYEDQYLFDVPQEFEFFSFEIQQFKCMSNNWLKIRLKLQEVFKIVCNLFNRIMTITLQLCDENKKVNNALLENNSKYLCLEEQLNTLQTELQNKDKHLQAVTDILNVYKENIDVDNSSKMNIPNVYENMKRNNEKYNQTSEKELETINSILLSDKLVPDHIAKQIGNLQKEKEQIMSILNEKSKENSSLKTEVLQLMDFMAASKNELVKLQQDNERLKKERKLNDKENSEMTKEAVHNLSRIIRDKDMEIEALNQKIQTLLTILQQSTPEGTHIQSILQERENLTKQINLYQTEREQIICALTQKHQESTSYHAEIQRLMSILSNETQKVSTLEQQHSKVVKQYEDKQKALINTQNELINLKHTVTELEEQQAQMKSKYYELFQKKEEPQDKVNSFEPILDHNNCDFSKLVKEKEQWLLEKDKLLYEYQQQIHHLKEVAVRREEEIITLKQQIEHLRVQISSYLAELKEEKIERETVEQKFQDMCTKASILNESNSRFTMIIHEKEFEVQKLKDKVKTLAEVIQQQSSTSDLGDIEELKGKLLLENDNFQKQIHEFQQERDEAMLALNQRQQENRELQNSLQQLREREKRLQNELERLRKHLLQVEESYTQEALHAEQREKDLRTRLIQAEEKARNASSSYTNASFQANLQMESLQQQLVTVAEQRDSALLKLDQMDDQVQQLTASLHTLQIVLERFQQEKEIEVVQLSAKHKEELMIEKDANNQLKQEFRLLQQRLEEAMDAVDAASRLSEKLDDKEEMIIALKQAVLDRESSLKQIQDEMKSINSSTEGKIDKLIIKNLVVNYLSVHPSQRLQILRIIGTVLDFNLEERRKVGLESNKTWISGWFKSSSPSPQHAPSTQSLSAAFIQFLENESRPMPALKLPTEPMSQSIIRKPDVMGVKTFSVPSSRSSIEFHQNQLLMKPMTTALPTFTPIPVSEHRTNVNSILKEMF